MWNRGEAKRNMSSAILSGRRKSITSSNSGLVGTRFICTRSCSSNLRRPNYCGRSLIAGMYVINRHFGLDCAKDTFNFVVYS